MKMAEGFFERIADLLWGNWMLVMLLGLGMFYTLITGGIQIKAVRQLAGKAGRGEFSHKKKEQNPEGLSSMQALCTAIASCVGSGNIVGVATALIAGGPGALFWMWIAAFFGMATKYGEIVLGICYREKEENGMYLGGPMYYIAHAMKTPWMGGIAALLLFIQNAGATLIQSNTIASVAQEVYRIPPIITGAFLAVLMSLIIRGGLKRLADVAQHIVPVMAGIYILGGTIVVLSHMGELLPMLKSVVQGALSMEAGLGAAAGVTVKEAMRYGVARGLYSNEAGEGSAAVIHSSAQVDHPSRQGLYGVAEVFVDTMVICSTTGFAILSSGISLEGASAATLAANAFGTVFPAFKYVVSVSLVLFASTSIMSQWYFGHVSLVYMKSKRGDWIYRFLFPVLILYGSLSSVGMVWAVQDCMLGLLIIPNVAALIILSPQVRRLTKEFFKPVGGYNMNAKIKNYIEEIPAVAAAAAGKEILWINDRKCPEAEQENCAVSQEMIEDARKRLERFAPYLAEVFPETAVTKGIIESELREIGTMKQELNKSWKAGIEGRLFLKMDSHLPISGSVKARGGIYEVLKHAEDLAMEAGLLTEEDDYRKLAEPGMQQFFRQFTVQVGSTGNLGLSIGIMSAKLGFKVIVHMSADAKQWKKDLLRSKGVTVIEYESDYCAAVEQGRADSEKDPSSYFVDDENSINLFLGYAVAGKRLQKQLEEKNIQVDKDHPLFVYLPCGIGGAPGGVAYGLKEIYGDAVHCFFMEPVNACCMLLGMATGEHDGVCVQDFLISGRTDADGLAVGRPSAFVGRVIEKRLSGICTIEDRKLYELMRGLLKTEDIFIEPSACASFAAFLHSEEMKEYVKQEGLCGCMDQAVHIAWATGGNMVPSDMVRTYLNMQ